MLGAASKPLAGVGEGEILGGKYLVEQVLGVGGMGVVVAARHLLLGTRVAIKFLLPQMRADADAIAKFSGEARKAAEIPSEHVVRVLDVGALEDGAPYMVMELLEGGDLARWLEQQGPLPVQLAVDFVLQACVAVAEAHGCGIIHRDLKPSNLFCVRRSDGQIVIKVLDFGISKKLDPKAAHGGASVTRTNVVMGSPLYMSPEQMRSLRDVDHRTDIWALGVILFELLCGVTPFVGTTVTQLAVKVTTEQPPLAGQARPDVPKGLDAVISTCLEKDRDRRYSNVAELAVALLPFGTERARALVQQVAGIVRISGLAALPSDSLSHRRSNPGAELNSVPPVGRTAVHRGRRQNVVGVLASAGLSAAVIGVGVAAWGAHRARPTQALAIRHDDAAPSHSFTEQLEPTTPSDEASAEPVSGSSRPAAIRATGYTSATAAVADASDGDRPVAPTQAEAVHRPEILAPPATAAHEPSPEARTAPRAAPPSMRPLPDPGSIR